MKAYKGFNADMTCRGFQYKEGETFETPKAEVCECGFHACLNPIDCFDYYGPGAKSVYHEVELDGQIDTRSDGDTKVSATKIKIGARLSIAGLVKAAFDFVRAKCTNENNAEPGKAASAGASGAASAGASGAASAGEYGAASAGYRGAASAGASGAAVSKGSASVGENGIACVRGNGVKVKGGIGSILVIAEERTDNYDIETWKVIKIDGKKYKADTWYILKNGKVIEAE